MNRFQHYIQTSLDILKGYQGGAPFHFALKGFFKQHHRYGSRDRKLISSLCYAFFRGAHALGGTINQENLLHAYFLSEHPNESLLDSILPGWGAPVTAPIPEKISWLRSQRAIAPIFPWPGLLSSGISCQSLALSLLHQPGFFARIRPRYLEQVLKLAATLKPPPGQPEPGCLHFRPGFNLQAFFDTDRELVVQDLQSQHSLDALHRYGDILSPSGTMPEIWDCCAASGGKSMLAYDLLGSKLILTVSDVRKQILHNLAARFEKAGINNYRSSVCDLENKSPNWPNESFDCIICDAPCTGSGTWGRTPEQLYFFDPVTLPSFSRRQLSIARHALPKLRRGGLFIYITCSVFAAENEDVATSLTDMPELELLEQHYLPGYEKGADTLYTAVFRKKILAQK